jgi:hypothetical protein
MQLPKMCIKKEELKPKACQYPGCNDVYLGTGFSKYCDLHRQREFRRKLDAINRQKRQQNNPNMIYKHENLVADYKEFTCALPGCCVHFTIMIYPNLFIYPKFCDEHRNEWKRKLFLAQHEIVIDEVKEIIEQIPDLTVPDKILGDVVDLNDVEEHIELVDILRGNI